MPKLNLQDYGTSRLKLTPEDLDEGPCLLTVALAEDVEVPDPTTRLGVRRSLTLLFTELPDKVMWLNKGQVETLIHRLGDNTDRWLGATVPVESYVAEFRGQRFPKVRVVPEEGWDVLLTPTKGSRRSRSTAAVKATGGRR